MTRKLVVTVTLTLLVSNANLFAADYYVAGNGNDAAPGTQSNPWKTIGKANSALSPGDTVYIRGGEYQEVIKPARSGSPGRMITYKAFPSERPVITNSPGRVAIVLYDRSYIEIDGLTVTGKKPGDASNLRSWAEIYGGGYNVIRNSDFQYATGWAGIELDLGAHHNRLINNRMDYVGAWDRGGGDDYGNMVNIKCASRNLVEGNVLTRGGHSLLSVFGAYNVIRGNSFDNKWGENKGNRTAEISAYRKCPGGYHVFEDNLVRNTLPASDTPHKSAQIKVDGIGHIVRRNVFMVGHNMAMSTAAWDAVPVSDRNHIYNNVTYAHGGPSWELRFQSSGGQKNDNNVFKNNLGYRNRLHPPKSEYDADFLIGTALKNNQIVSNSMYNPGEGGGTVMLNGTGADSLQELERRYPGNFSKNLAADPKFVSSDPQEYKDFRLSAESPLIDAAADLTTTAGSGSGKLIAVKDSGYFFDGLGVVEGDEIQVGSNPPVRVVAVDYANHEITVNTTLSWKAGDGVNLQYSGAAPDIGAYEYSETTNLAAPTNLRISIR